jgi:peptidoglycan/LPS O-acetylase OafA/YrhL
MTTTTSEQAPAMTQAVTPTENVRGAALPPEGAPRRARARELEGYRGLAALTIVAFHVFQFADQAGGVSSSWITALARFETVDILFLMSAYLLTLSYARAAIDRTPTQPARQFLFRRAVRILPLYWIGVTVVWAIRNPVLPGDWVDLLEHLTFTHIFDRTRIFYTLGPTWSMSLEVIFYLLLVLLGPLAAKACTRIDSRPARVTLLLAGSAVLALIPLVWNSVAFLVMQVPFDNWPVYFGPQARFGAFAAGMALAVVVAARRTKPLFTGIWPSVLRVVGIGIVAAAAWTSEPGTLGQVIFHDVAAVGWLLLMASTVLGTPGQLWSRVLSWRALTWVGLISYSTYMWHEPIMMLMEHAGLTTRSAGDLPMAVLLVVSASLLAGWVSYHVIEKPTGKLRMLRDREGRPRDYYPDLARTGGG